MKISMRSDYGARALLYLAERYGEGPVQSAEIASRQAIPEAYLEQLLTVFRRAGLIRSVRGPAGGHLLARHPRDIRLREIVAVMEGPTPRLSCCNEYGCQVLPNCVLAEVWHELERATREVLDSVTLQDLLDRQEAAQRRVMYHI
ncbi:MAG: Rrf2 family transcriptional regulator [Chloroflexi bacterium]|nr:Rrf2 family transcriptional regulator [Chloroflexota bacterium]